MASHAPTSHEALVAPTRQQAAPARSLASPHRGRWLCAAVAAGGLALVAFGGAGRPGALDLLPGCDGALVSGVVAMILLVLHGHSARFALLAVSPIVALAGVGFMQQHRLPLAPLGLQIALIGAVGLCAELLREPP